MERNQNRHNLNVLEVKNYLQQIDTQKLLGLDAQLKMAPEMRSEELKQGSLSNGEAKRSAILILLFPIDGQLHTLMMKRASKLHHHAGQMSFPGGGIDTSDESPWDTAIRETEEETGINKTRIQFLTQLSDLYIPPTNYDVNVFCGYMDSLPQLHPNTDEVDTLVPIPLTYFLNGKHIEMREFSIGSKRTLAAPAYIYKEHVIWGASAMMMSELVEIIKKMPTK